MPAGVSGTLNFTLQGQNFTMAKAITSHFAFKKYFTKTNKNTTDSKNESVVFFTGRRIIIFLCCFIASFAFVAQKQLGLAQSHFKFSVKDNRYLLMGFLFCIIHS